MIIYLKEFHNGLRVLWNDGHLYIGYTLFFRILAHVPIKAEYGKYPWSIGVLTSGGPKRFLVGNTEKVWIENRLDKGPCAYEIALQQLGAEKEPKESFGSLLLSQGQMVDP